jgi:hypothetical protein
MTEAELQATAEAACDQLGLLWHHCTDPRRCRGPRGFPDLVVLGPRGWLTAEFKSPDGETTADQDRWIWTAWQSGLAIPVLRPADKEQLAVLLKSIA